MREARQAGAVAGAVVGTRRTCADFHTARTASGIG